MLTRTLTGGLPSAVEVNFRTRKALMAALEDGREFRFGPFKLKSHIGELTITLLESPEHKLEEIVSDWQESKGDRFPDVKPSDIVSIVMANGKQAQGATQTFQWDSSSEMFVRHWRKIGREE